ncbi:MAG TPA: AAA domain-containing protein [Chloroflexota bacterium]
MTPDAWRALLAGGAPVDLDVAVVARKVAERSGRSKLVLDLAADDGRPLGLAYVFPGEWYPGCGHAGRFSHYFPVLYRVLQGLEQRGQEPRVRLQVLKAVNVGRDAPYVVLLKFIVCPEHTVTGAELERVYQCPLSGFYLLFLGVARHLARTPGAPSYLLGITIHRAYQRAARAFARTRDREAARRAYLQGVADAWTDEFASFLLDTARSPTQLYRLPVTMVDAIVERCAERWDGPALDHLLQERLFFSPTRGLSGKADRLLGPPGTRLLYEVKAGASFFALDSHPLTGRRAPGGIQALAYHETLRSVDGRPPTTAVELVAPGQLEEVPLSDHPVVARAQVRVEQPDDRYVDLLAQGRNVAFAVQSGLLTGYDRDRLNALAKNGQRLRGLGGDFSLYGVVPPCRSCAAQARQVCEQASGSAHAPWYDFFRHVPERLYAYWSWFHGQLKDEERRGREHLYHLATTPVPRLERDEGICVPDLELVALRGRLAHFHRDARIETRLREDDRVLITPMDERPGEIASVEGTIRSVEGFELVVEVADDLPARPSRYRVDELGFFDRTDWQIQGLTDFLLESMFGSGVRGRGVALEELPRLTRILLGAERPTPSAIASGVAPGVSEKADPLNEQQRRALHAALALPPGDLLLIQGPPGTGKTSLLAHLVAELARRGPADAARRPVLVLANTHRACNEIVLKLCERFPDLSPAIVRVGKANHGMEPEVRRHVLSERLAVRERLASVDMVAEGPATMVRLVQEMKRVHREARIFVGTLASAQAPELRGLEFETLVVDECGQATEPAALQALRHAAAGYQSRLILVGDHHQLPPVVDERSVAPPIPEALRAAGFRDGHDLRVSLFERLVSLYPEACVRLERQYRMNAPICHLVGETFYGGRLAPGAPEVAARRLAAPAGSTTAAAPHPIAAPARRSSPLASALDPALPVVLLDTSDDPLAASTSDGAPIEEAKENPREAAVVAWIVHGLLTRAGAAAPRLASAVGIISPYRRHNHRIRHELRIRLPELADLVRVDTVDRFQGGEREVVVVSLVAHDPDGAIGRLHADWRRMNVAVSRARSKLIIVGSRRTFTAPRSSGGDEARAEAEAKRLYRRLFRIVDVLAAEGLALVLPTAGISLDVEHDAF